MNNYFQEMKEHLRKMQGWRISARILFFVLGISSTVWFLIRVIPKPSRAGYPCMRAAAPVMSAFVLYLISISASVLAFRKFKQRLFHANYIAALGFLLIGILIIVLSGTVKNTQSQAAQLVGEKYFTPNDPIGIARGIHPGRVVWVWNKDATHETCTNSSGDYWFQNTNTLEVDTMLVRGIMELTGESTPEEAWDALFRYFNSNYGHGDVGYTSGEKVYIKLNITNSCCSVTGTTKTDDFERMDATPELSLALLRQLIEVVGVAQSDIYLGDPFRTFHNLYWDMCHSVYPDVNYCDEKGINGRHQTVATDTNVIKFSDGVNAVRIPQEYMDAAYFINMPCLKTHNEGAITLTAKNHQGTILEQGTDVTGQSAFVMHPSLPANDPGMGKYRHLVDYMGHNKLGGNTLIFIVDGIWAGKSWEGFVEKWQMEPFNNDYPSSLFLSQDEVAIQAVCYDFLLEEYKNKPSGEKYPYMDGADDFLYQAADPSYWPAGTEYDPEGDGSIIGSLGVYEHWNNASEKLYSRNLETGDGIELVIDTLGNTVLSDAFKPLTENRLSIRNYPNPATDRVYFDYNLKSAGRVMAEVYSINGSKLVTLLNEDQYAGSHQLTWNIEQLPEGIYLFSLQFKTADGIMTATNKFRVE